MPTETTTAPDTTPLKEGDLIRLDYEIWADGGEKTELVDTTREEVAQAAKIPIPQGTTFGPHAHLVGGEYFPAGIEAALVGAKIGEPFEKEFPPAAAFGERDPKLIELFSMHEISRLPEMRREDAELNLGTVLTIEGRRGRVVTITAARVRVDFNPPYSGRKVKAKFAPVSRIEEPAEQVKALIDLTYGRGPEFKVQIHQGTVTIHVPERSKFDFNWMAAKPRVIDRVRTQLKPKAIHLVEEYVTPVPKADSPPATTTEANPVLPSNPAEAPAKGTEASGKNPSP
jgi:FKBP-type peptidyl-prolyl cis-trans isomerase 2